MIVQGITPLQFRAAVAKAGAAHYHGNLVALIGREYSPTRFAARVTIDKTGSTMFGPGDDLAPGQRRSGFGRRIKAACWHAYRDVLTEVFATNPEANVYTAMAKYRGREGFEQNYPATAERNVGSAFAPAFPDELCDCTH